MSIASVLKRFRTERNLSQVQVAKKINVSEKAYNHWENEVSLPSIDNLKLLAALFGVTLDELCEFTPNALNQPDEYDVAVAKMKNMGVILVDKGNDVEINTYGTINIINKTDLPDIVRRAEILHRRMARGMIRESFAAAVILTIQNFGENRRLTMDYLEEMMEHLYNIVVPDNAEITPSLVADYLKERLKLMSVTDRKAAWEQAVRYISEQGTDFPTFGEDGEIISMPEEINLLDLPEWKYNKDWFK